jgi:hypothetical protein
MPASDSAAGHEAAISQDLPFRASQPLAYRFAGSRQMVAKPSVTISHRSLIK